MVLSYFFDKDAGVYISFTGEVETANFIDGVLARKAVDPGVSGVLEAAEPLCRLRPTIWVLGPP